LGNAFFWFLGSGFFSGGSGSDSVIAGFVIAGSVIAG
jgi:hypothetical protein